MKSSENNIQNLDLAFEQLFGQETDYETEAKVLASKILSEISIITDKRGLTRKNVAEIIGTSASYITQLYRGTKLLNLITLIKLKDKLDLDIEIRIKDNSFNTSDGYASMFTNKHGNETNLKEINWLIYNNKNTDEVAMTEETPSFFNNPNKSKSKTHIKEQLIA